MKHSRHDIRLRGLPARHWKWRMHGAAVTFAQQILADGEAVDLIVADDMMDVAVFVGLIRSMGIKTPVVTYFHENQISYPVSPRDTDLIAARDLHYGYINYTTALVSEKVYFNSHYHKRSFFEALPDFLDRYPDFQNKGSVETIAAKCEVLPLGMDLQALDAHRPNLKQEQAKPLLLWNHRWEYDKCPNDFLKLLLALDERGLSFEVALLGEKRTEAPPLLETVRAKLGKAILQDGPVVDFGSYAKWLWRADILPVTGIQDFFGGSVVEAIYAGCHPVLPDRLAYPEHVADKRAFYESPEEALEAVSELIASGAWKQASPHSESVRRYDWAEGVSSYDDALAESAEIRP